MTKGKKIERERKRLEKQELLSFGVLLFSNPNPNEVLVVLE